MVQRNKITTEITKDGSLTLYDPNSQEHHHSLVGAYTESRYKYIEPAKIIFDLKLNSLEKEKQKNKKTIRILDLPFGVGYNSLVSLKYLRENRSNYSSDFFLDCLGIENNQEVIEKIKNFQPGFQDLNLYFNLISNLSKNYQIKKSDFQISLIKKSLFESLPELIKNYQNYFDLIYFDPFSPRHTPEFWSKEKVLFFISKLLNDSGLIITYTSSNKVRKAFLELGLKIAPSFPVGRRDPGTLAFKNLNFLGSFEEKILKKIEKSFCYL